MIVQRIREPKVVHTTALGDRIANAGDIVVQTDSNAIELYTTPAAFIAAYPGVGQAINWRKDIDDILEQADVDVTAITAAQVRGAFVSMLRLLRRNGFLDVR